MLEQLDPHFQQSLGPDIQRTRELYNFHTALTGLSQLEQDITQIEHDILIPPQRIEVLRQLLSGILPDAQVDPHMPMYHYTFSRVFRDMYHRVDTDDTPLQTTDGQIVVARGRDHIDFEKSYDIMAALMITDNEVPPQHLQEFGLSTCDKFSLALTTQQTRIMSDESYEYPFPTSAPRRGVSGILYRYANSLCLEFDQDIVSAATLLRDVIFLPKDGFSNRAAPANDEVINMFLQCFFIHGPLMYQPAYYRLSFIQPINFVKEWDELPQMPYPRARRGGRQTG